MLKCFLEIGAKPSLFDGLYISENKQLCSSFMGKYPVVFITLKNVDGLSFEEAKYRFVDVIGSEDRAFHPAKIAAPPHPEPESEAEQKPDEEKQADGDKSADLSPKAGRRITKVIPDRLGAGV